MTDIGRELSLRTVISGRFEYWNNGNAVSLSQSIPDFIKYSFRKEMITPGLLTKLCKKGNLIF